MLTRTWMFLCSLRLGCASDVIPSVFPTEIECIFYFLFLMHAAFRANFIFLDLITTTKLVIKFSPSCCFLCFWSKYFPQTPSLFVFPPEWGPIFQSYKSTVNIILPYYSVTLHVLVLFSSKNHVLIVLFSWIKPLWMRKWIFRLFKTRECLAVERLAFQGLCSVEL